MSKQTIDTKETNDTEDSINWSSNPESNDSAPEITEPARKRSYKPRAPKIKEETLDASEAPARKPRRSKSSVENTAKQIEGIHKMVAMLPNMGFMNISPEEARILAEAMTQVSEEYNVQISGKTAATIQLFMAASMVYAPRVVYAVHERKKRKAQEPVMPPENQSSGPLTVATGSENSVTE